MKSIPHLHGSTNSKCKLIISVKLNVYGALNPVALVAMDYKLNYRLRNKRFHHKP